MVRDRLGEETWGALWSAGQALSLDDAVAEAFELLAADI
jgi:hypothetical protein